MGGTAFNELEKIFAVAKCSGVTFRVEEVT